ncbi:MAG: hypothetical protein LBG58_12860 [Planctomycetaceae bacterium]|jgi:hypothetical protein|nr:hypothetical protein [Planctomycetaceae bacterium]
MPAWIHITKGTVPENLFDIISSFSKVGSDLDGNICIPSESIPPCAFILEYNASQQIYYIIPRCDHVLRYENYTLNRGTKTEWVPGTVLEIAGELELELEVDDDNPEPVAAPTIIERRTQEIEQSEIEEQSGEQKEETDAVKAKSAASDLSISPVYIIVLLIVLSGLILPFFLRSSRSTPPDNPTEENSKLIKHLFLSEIKENPLEDNYKLWFQWFKDAMIEENLRNYTEANKNYKNIRNGIYEHWKKTGQSEKIQKIVQTQNDKESNKESDDEETVENNLDHWEIIFDFTVKKLRYLRWHLEEKK